MIEMLGVLAIIGVLSSGGIWAYSAAMDQYKINRFIEQVQSVGPNLRNYFGKPAEKSNNMEASGICHLDLLLKQWCKDRVGTYIKDTLVKNYYFGHKGMLYAFVWHYPKTFGLAISGSFYRAHCVKLLSFPWKNTFSATSFKTGGEWYVLPIDKTKVKELCQSEPEIFFNFTYAY